MMMRRQSIFLVLAASALMLAACGSKDSAQEETTENASIVETIPAEEAADAATTEEEVDPIELADGEVPMGVMLGETDGVPEISVDWDQMEGVAAWLVIPGANVSTGVYESETSDGAWIDPNNYVDFTDPDTVIHGGVGDGQVLHGVRSYEDGDVYEANRDMYIYLADGQVLVYRIFAAYSADTEDILVNHPTSDYASFEAYVQEIYGIRSLTAHIDADLESEVLGTWQMLTIQASDGAGSDYVLQGTLTVNGLSD